MSKIDVLGAALLDYYRLGQAQDIITETNISEADEMPVAHFFRGYNDMPLLEQEALQRCEGRVLDIGCGAGSHSLYLQSQGLEVKAIDISKGAVEVAKARGVLNAQPIHVNAVQAEQFDTLLILMNGTGIFENIAMMPHYLNHLKSLLKTGGKVIIDSSDLSYMYDTEENGAIWVPADRYYGELTFTMEYKGIKSEPFDWLYLDQKKMKTLCKQSGFHFSIVKEGNHYEYLAVLTLD